MSKYIDMTGQRFGRVTVVRYAKAYKDGTAIWECRCDCGNTFTVIGRSLRTGNTRSCGCLNDEVRKQSKGGTHKGRLYTIWKNMRSRCNKEYNSRYAIYGGKGVSVCKEWDDFENFKEWALANGYSDDLTIDRIDVNGNYEPGNCRWADYYTQESNKTNVKLYPYCGENLSLKEISRRCGVRYETLRKRVLKLGWNIEKATSELAYIGKNGSTGR